MRWIKPCQILWAATRWSTRYVPDTEGSGSASSCLPAPEAAGSMQRVKLWSSASQAAKKDAHHARTPRPAPVMESYCTPAHDRYLISGSRSREKQFRCTNPGRFSSSLVLSTIQVFCIIHIASSSLIQGCHMVEQTTTKHRPFVAFSCSRFPKEEREEVIRVYWSVDR